MNFPPHYPQQGGYPDFNNPHGPHGPFPGMHPQGPHGNWNYPPQPNWNQQPQGSQPPQKPENQTQPSLPPQYPSQPPTYPPHYAPPQTIPPQQSQYPPQQPQYPPQQTIPPQQPQYPPQPGYAQQQYQPYQPYGFRNEIMDMKNRYGMNIPDDQIDQTIEEAKNRKRMYAFPEKDTNYVRYDDKGKSYIASLHGFGFAHHDNKQFFDERNDPNSYDGIAKHLIKVCWLDIKLRFNHVKPGNYKLFLNQCFEGNSIKGKMTFRVFVCDKLILEDKQFPNDEMVKVNKLSEYYIRDIRREDFDMSKLDQNGDAVVRLEFAGNDNGWKKDWIMDGAKLLDMDQTTAPSQGGFQPAYAQQQGYPPQQTIPAQPQPIQPQPGYPSYPPQQVYPQYQSYQPYGFRNEIMDMKNRYGMNIPDDQIDQTIEEAKNRKRMYAFPEKDTNYVRYDDKGKSYIASLHGFGFAHHDNKQFFDERNDPNSYDGIAKHLIKVCWLDIKLRFNHVKPGNYKLFLNQCFEGNSIKGKMTFRVFVCDKLILEDKQFPNDEMVKVNKLSEYYIRDIRREDFDMSKLDQNGDAVVRLEFAGNDNGWKKDWIMDGAKLLDMDQTTAPSQGGFQPAYAQQQGYPPQQTIPAQPQPIQPQPIQPQPGYPSYPPQPQPGYPSYPPQQVYPQYQSYQPYGFRNEIMDMKNRYGMNIPDDQIDQTIEEAKNRKRMYAFPEKDTNYVRYDDKGKSYIASLHGFGFAHHDNKQFFDERNDPNSYDGIAKHLIKVCWLDIKLRFNHVKPGNYKLFLNQCFEGNSIKGKMTFRVFVCDKLILEDKQFPNDEMVKVNKLSEYYIRDIRREDFDMSKLDQNGDAVVRIEFAGNDNGWKKGWTMDGAKLLEI